MTFPALLRDRRKHFDMTQSDLANRIGVSQGTVSKYENGELDPSVRDLYRLSHVIGVSVFNLVRSVVKFERK